MEAIKLKVEVECHFKWFSLSKPDKLRTASYEREHCQVLQFVLLQVNVTRYFYLLVSNGNLTLRNFNLL